MNILIWMVVGGMLGWFTSLSWTIDDEMGTISNIVVGMCGALIGGWLMTLVTGQGLLGFDIWSITVAFLGAVAFIGIMSGTRTRVGRGF